MRCHAGGQLQVRTVSGSEGYGSTSDLTVHFGLGAATRAVVEIRWPSGVVQNLGEMPSDQRLNVAEAGRLERRNPATSAVAAMR